MNDDLAPLPDLSFDYDNSHPHAGDPVLADAERLHARILATHRALRQCDYQLAVLLCDVADTGAYRALGYARISDYAAATLDFSARKTRDRIASVRRLRDLPALKAAAGCSSSSRPTTMSSPAPSLGFARSATPPRETRSPMASPWR